MGFLSTKRRIFEPGRSRFAFLLIGICAFVATELGRYVYRPFVRVNSIDDFGLADCIGNLGGVVVQIFLGAAVLNCTPRQSYRAAAFFAAGYVLYEFAQPYLPRGAFDWKDILATAMGYLVSVLLLSVMWRIVGSGEGSVDSRQEHRHPVA